MENFDFASKKPPNATNEHIAHYLSICPNAWHAWGRQFESAISHHL